MIFSSTNTPIDEYKSKVMLAYQSGEQNDDRPAMQYAGVQPATDAAGVGADNNYTKTNKVLTTHCSLLTTHY